MALIADYFNRAERPRAAALYGMGGGISAVIGYFLAGWLNEFYGWRVTFMVLGIPGVILAPLAWFTLKEPRRQQNFNARIDDVRALGFDERFVRKWRYYFSYCEAAFTMRNISVVQTLHTRPNNPSL